MAQQQKTSVKGCAKKGRNKKKCERYKNANRRVINKMRRVLSSNGPLVALAYASARNTFNELRQVRRIAPARFARAVSVSPEFAKFAKG